MAVIETMLRHQKIISLLLRRRANFEEIDAMLKYETEIRDPNKRLDISKRTFQRDKEYIQELYGITITCDKDGCYYIEQNDELEADTRFYDMFTLYHELKMEGRLRRGILLEERQETGTRFLKDLLHAIEDNKVVQLRHKEYWEEEGTEYLVQPYFIKEYDQRWYLLAKEVATKKERRFGLDRISHLEVLKEKYEPEDFELAKKLKDSIGISEFKDGSGKKERVLLQFTRWEGRYIKAMKMHHSQKLVRENEREVVVSLDVYITYNLISEILKHHEKVKVLEPPALVEIIKEKYAKALAKYQDNGE